MLDKVKTPINQVQSLTLNPNPLTPTPKPLNPKPTL